VVASHGQDPDAQLKEIVAWNKKFDDAGLILDGDPRKTTDKGQVQGPQQAKDGGGEGGDNTNGSNSEPKSNS